MGNLPITAEPGKVSVTFFNATTKLIETADVGIPAGTVAGLVATRNAAERMARATGAPMFAIPSFVYKGADGAERWLVFKMSLGSAAWRTAVLLRDWPTRAAAEMWMQHNAE